MAHNSLLNTHKWDLNTIYVTPKLHYTIRFVIVLDCSPWVHNSRLCHVYRYMWQFNWPLTFRDVRNKFGGV